MRNKVDQQLEARQTNVQSGEVEGNQALLQSDGRPINDKSEKLVHQMSKNSVWNLGLMVKVEGKARKNHPTSSFNPQIRDCLSVRFAVTWYLLGGTPCARPAPPRRCQLLGKKRGGTSPFPTECLPSRMIINFLPLIF
jgi:hypothetical protein